MPGKGAVGDDGKAAGTVWRNLRWLVFSHAEPRQMAPSGIILGMCAILGMLVLLARCVVYVVSMLGP